MICYNKIMKKSDIEYKSRFQGFTHYNQDSNIKYKYLEPIAYAKKIKNIEQIDKCPLCGDDKYIKVGNFKINSMINNWIVYHGFNPFPKIYNDKVLEKRYCTNCGLYFYNYHIPDDDTLYANLNKNEKYYPTYREEYGPCIEYILKKKPKSLLEIGAGDGEFLSIVKNVVPNVVGSEYNSQARKKCLQKGLNVLGEDISLIDSKFDLICHFEVLEHVFDTKTLMEKSVKLLKKGGALIIGAPNPDELLVINGVGALNLPPHHQFDFSYKTFKYLAKKYKLKIVDYVKMDFNYRHYKKYVNLLTGEETVAPDIAGYYETMKRYKGHTHVIFFKKK